MKLTKIISGGQTGVDQGALAAAKILGIPTGGCMPKDFRTETGSRPDLAELYNLTEHHEYTYPPRTLYNVVNSDGTLIFGNNKSPGCLLTAKCCREEYRRHALIPWISDCHKPDKIWIKLFRLFLDEYNISVLNVAGNRESSQPGIHEAVKEFLLEALS